MNYPKFSIILPTFNRKKFIKKSVDSILGQEYPESEFEVLIVDDGSTDDTNFYIENLYKEDLHIGKIKFIRFESNIGVSFARNQGLKEAKNEWIAYLDSDNLMRDNFLKTFSEYIKTNPDKKVFYGKMKRVNSEVIVGKEFDFSDLTVSNFIDLGVFVHSRKIYEKLGGFDEDLDRLVDWDLILRYTEKHYPIFIDEVLLDYYDGDKNDRISNSKSKEKNYKKVILKYLDSIPDDKFFINRINERKNVKSKDRMIANQGNEIKRMQKKLKEKEQQLNSVVTTLRWKIPNYIYKALRRMKNKIIN